MRRFLFINATHPGDGHVSALRVYSLARSLAAQGDQIFFVTREARGRDSARSGDRITEEWKPLNAGEPRLLHLAIPGDPNAGKNKGRPPYGVAGRTLSRAATAINWMRGRSSDPLWVRSATEVLPRALRGIEIDLVWATFTPIETWTIGHRFARTREIPFVGDVKDPWSYYVPAALRQLVWARHPKLAALTFNSKELRSELPKAAAQLPHRVIYSGYWRSTVNRSEAPRGNPHELTAAFFGRLQEQPYRELLVALNSWARYNQARIAIKYWGRHAEVVENLVEDLSSLTMDANDYIGTEELIRECSAVDFNFYVRAGYQGIHHKATELLAARKPILVWGSETSETIGLADRTRIPLLGATTAGALALQMEAIAKTTDESALLGDEQQLDALSWEEQGRLLGEFLEATIARAK